MPGVEKIVPAGMGMSRLAPLLEDAEQAEINEHNNNPALRPKDAQPASPASGTGLGSASGQGLGPGGAPGAGVEALVAGMSMESDEVPEGEIRFEFTEHELVNEVS